MSIGVWTNNWKGYKNTMILGYSYPGMATLTDMNGNRMPYATQSYITMTASPFAPIVISSSYSSSTMGYNVVYLGSGGKEPAEEDFSLENRLTSISYLRATSEGITWDVGNGTATRKAKLIVQNPGSSTITIREWGLFKALIVPDSPAGESSVARASTIGNAYFMLYREVLDTPIALPALQSATLELTLSITLADPI